MEMLTVGIAEGKIICSPGILVAYALGSCVGVCLYDSRAKLAGMVHILLPSQDCAIHRENKYKFADTGIALLVDEMEKRGAKRSRITAKLAGGAELFPTIEKDMNIGSRNVSAAKEWLKKQRIPVMAEDTGNSYGRTVSFSAQTGEMTVKTVRNQLKVL